MDKLILVRPSEVHIAEIRAYRDEFRAHDTHAHGDNGLYGWDDIPGWIDFCRKMQNKETLPNPKYVESDQYMLMLEGEPRILGMINLRRSLKDGYLAEHAGNIGYGVRPLERRKGYATAMLKLCLEEARALGLAKVLICCDLDNAGSRGAIKACGGVFERLAITGCEVDERYWINLDGTSEPPQPPESIFNTGDEKYASRCEERSDEAIQQELLIPDNLGLLRCARNDDGDVFRYNNNDEGVEHDHLGNFYTARDEDARLISRHGLVEYLTTMRYVERYLTPNARVIEIGAGTGRYSRTIADMGHKVEAVELVPVNIDVFRQNLKPSQEINITQANALELSMFADDIFDVTLLLGPLYHLYSDDDKHRAIAEALRVTKPGGVVFAAYCLSDASLMYGGFARQAFDIKDYIKRGKINPATFATTSKPEDIFELVRKEDIDRLMAPFGAQRLHYVATDMFTHWIRDAVDAMDDETFALYLRYHFAICERADMVGASHHSLDVFRKC